MSQGPSLIFDKSALHGLNIDEAFMMDTFYMSTITPLFLVECLADLEKASKRNIPPEQIVGVLAERTPDCQSRVNVHHMHILEGELYGHFDLSSVHGHPARAGGKAVQLGDQKGFVYKESEEAIAFQRWARREFKEVERETARRWRRSLTGIDLDAMVKRVASEIGPWRKPKTLQDAKQIAETIIDHLDPEFLLRFGLDLLGLPDHAEPAVYFWKANRRPNLREYLPYFVLMLTINLFFCLALPAQLFSNVKPSHIIDLAYLYYLPFCNVFVSNDNFHKSIVPLFLGPEQEFISGVDFKEDLKKIVAHFQALPEEERMKGAFHYARFPPQDDSLITVRLWDKYFPGWRKFAEQPHIPISQEENDRIIAEVKNLAESPDLKPADIPDIQSANYVTFERLIRPKKGSFQRMSDEQIRQSIQSRQKK